MHRAPTVATIAIFATASPFAHAETFTVRSDGSGDFITIQGAIDYCFDGDVVLVEPGVYRTGGDQLFDTLGKAIEIRSIAGPERTILDGEDVRRGILCSGGETASTVIEGFTIRNGRAPGYDWSGNGTIETWESFGGAIWCRGGGSPTIRNCRLEGGRAEYGGGLFCGDELGGDSRPRLEQCEISDGGIANGVGGGAYHWGSSPTYVDCRIAGNRGYGGAGMYNFRGSAPVLEDCVFEDNVAERYGGGMYNDGSAPVLTGCSLRANRSGGDGGAVFNADPGSAANIPLFFDCRFESNVASEEGGAIQNVSCSPVIVDCEIVENVAGAAGAMSSAFGSTPELRRSTICGNGPDPIAGPVADDGTNDISDTCGTGACPEDFNGDGIVDAADLGQLFIQWGPCTGCSADLDGTGDVDGADLGRFFLGWGPCS